MIEAVQPTSFDITLEAQRTSNVLAPGGIPTFVDHTFRLDIASEPPTQARFSVRITAEQAADEDMPVSLINFEVSAWVELGGLGEMITDACLRRQASPYAKTSPGIRPEAWAQPLGLARRLSELDRRADGEEEMRRSG